MTDLVQWLREQLVEDERTARAACEGGAGRWQALGDQHGGSVAGDHDGYHVACDEGYPTVEQATHIAAHDPARVLRETEAKQAVVAELEAAEYAMDEASRNRDTARYNAARAEWQVLTRIVRRDAAVYADRPGYREEWRP